jgi:hypothetical protein
MRLVVARSASVHFQTVTEDLRHRFMAQWSESAEVLVITATSSATAATDGFRIVVASTCQMKTHTAGRAAVDRTPKLRSGMCSPAYPRALLRSSAGHG